MRIKFWGTRGSLPAPLAASDVRDRISQALLAASGRRFDSEAAVQAFIEKELPFAVSGTFGGNSACVEIDPGGDEHVLCDLGTGARVFGNEMLRGFGPDSAQRYHVFLSHTHWDHIMGFPLFAPAYLPGNSIRLYGCHATIEEAFRRQHSAPCFPVDFTELRAKIEFVHLEPDRAHDIAGMKITPKLQRHSGDSYGYRFEHAGKTVVYSTDSEHKLEIAEETRGIVEFFRAADLVIFDAMYSLADAVSMKEDWGHSSNVVGVELCQLAGARHLCMIHHEPAYNDAKIAQVLDETRRFELLTRSDAPLEVTSAYDGLELWL